MDTKHEKHDKRWYGFFDRFLDHQINKRIDTYIAQDATLPNGQINEPLARRIRWEVGRRGETGKQLDIYEPLRWTGIRALLGIAGAATAKTLTDRFSGKTKTLAWGIELGLIIGTAINSIIDLMRLYPRWMSGLEGGKNTALKLHHEFDPPPNDQALLTYRAPVSDNQFHIEKKGNYRASVRQATGTSTFSDRVRHSSTDRDISL